MNDKKYSTHLGIINSEKWKQLREYFNHYTFEYNNFDYSKTENEVIEYLRILYSNIDKQLNNALEYLQTNSSISILEKNKILAYSKELNKLKFECEQKLISLNQIEINDEKIKKAFDFELENTIEPLYSKKVLKFVKNIHKKTKIEIEKYINSRLDVISEIDFAFNDLLSNCKDAENRLYNIEELTYKNIQKKEKLIKKIELLNKSKLEWEKKVPYFVNNILKQLQ
tara:strand:+ start:1731 stop:2408 length:678 start_codon:yes stop_codon:yes gene_type:complete